MSAFGPAARFSYDGYELDAAYGRLICRYRLDDHQFAERYDLGAGAWGSPAAREAARLVYLLAGVSYYKAGAPPLVEFDVPLRVAEAALLGDFYREGLGEFAYRNGLDLSELELRAELTDARAAGAVDGDHPLVPFGGGIDSIVTAESVKSHRPDARLFIVMPASGPFEAIERVVPITGLPAVRVVRHLDEALLRPASETGFLQGHVPVTGIITALGALSACGRGQDAVVLSNEWSASSGNLHVGGHTVNHQYSKSWGFESAFSAVVRGAIGERPLVFSHLRPFTELWVARRFSSLPEYHRDFHSCNRAFSIDPTARLRRWCGRCDKCAFIDLVLAPFMSKVDLEAIFDGAEPLAQPDLFESFAVLTGLSPDPKPFECVGEVAECRAAAVLAAERGDRRRDAVLQRLAGQLPPVGPTEVARLLAPHHPHQVPDDLAARDQLV